MDLSARLIESGLKKEQIITSIDGLFCYGYDATRQIGRPRLVVLPTTAEQIATIISLANREKIAVFPRGAGSGMSGGSVPVTDGIVISLTEMKKILDLDLENMTVLVEPGVITGELQEEVKKHGLMYPPDPASLAFSTLGGNVAENAGGPRAVKYGVTSQYVRGLEVVLPDGKIIKTGNKCIKSVSGYDLTHLFVGSEGTLGVITKILLRLVPAPKAVQTMLLGFATMDNAAQAITAMFHQHIIPATIEFLDHYSINAVKDSLPFTIPKTVKTLLLVEVDGDQDLVERDTETIKKLLEDNTLMLMVATTTNERQAVWQARRALSPAIASLAPHKINEDIAVPIAQIPAVLRRFEEISRQTKLTIVCFGHAGDGNIHVNIMLDKNDPLQAAAGEQALKEIFSAVIELGGTLSGEHGIGNTKSDFFSLEWDSNTITAMRLIKKAFDPNNILNPGKIFPVNR